MLAQLKYCFLVLLIAGYATQNANASGFGCTHHDNDTAACKKSGCHYCWNSRWNRNVCIRH
eukprot:Pgem_evm1s12548